MNSINILTNYTGGLYAFIRKANGVIDEVYLTPQEISQLENILNQVGLEATFLTIILSNMDNIPYHVHIIESRQYEVKEADFDYNDPWLRNLVQDIWQDFIQKENLII